MWTYIDVRKRIARIWYKAGDFILDEGETLKKDENFTADYLAVGICGITIAWLSQPLLRYSNPVYLFWLGIGICAVVLLLAIARGVHSRNLRTLLGLGVAAFTIYLGWSLFVASRVLIARSSANDRRCYAIQADMLSPRPRRQDGPALFEALGCRPDGQQNVSFMAPRSVPLVPPQGSERGRSQ